MLRANQDKFQDKFMGTLTAAERSEINVLDYAIHRLDQEDFRIRLRSALDEVWTWIYTPRKLSSVFSFVGGSFDAEEGRGR